MNAEVRALRVSAVASLLVGIVALFFSALAVSQAILLDGMFNLIYFVMSLFSLRVTSLLQRPDDARFPFGYAYFEPLMNLSKGLLVLGVGTIALINAVVTIAEGGSEIEPGPAVGYALFATAVGWIAVLVLAYYSKKTPSPLLAADVKNWVMNAALSTVVVLTFASVFLLRNTSYAYLVPYIDPGLVALLILLVFPMPLRIVRSNLMELINAAPDVETVARVETAVLEATRPLEPANTVVRVLRVGRQLYALVHVVLDMDASVLEVSDLDSARARMVGELRAGVPGLAVDFVFTTDVAWASPAPGDTVTPPAPLP